MITNSCNGQKSSVSLLYYRFQIAFKKNSEKGHALGRNNCKTAEYKGKVYFLKFIYYYDF